MRTLKTKKNIGGGNPLKSFISTILSVLLALSVCVPAQVIAGSFVSSEQAWADWDCYYCEHNNLNWLIDENGHCNIPEGVENIPDSAFEGCENLITITIPDSVQSIGDYAFNMCPFLSSVDIPNSVEYIGDYAFGECPSLTSITIPDSVQSIGDSVFTFCSSLSYVSFPEDIEEIPFGMFESCGLTSVIIPNTVKTIGYSAFVGCPLTSITIPDSVQNIELSAFTMTKLEYYSDIKSNFTNAELDLLSDGEHIFRNGEVIYYYSGGNSYHGVFPKLKEGSRIGSSSITLNKSAILTATSSTYNIYKLFDVDQVIENEDGLKTASGITFADDYMTGIDLSSFGASNTSADDNAQKKAETIAANINDGSALPAGSFGFNLASGVMNNLTSCGEIKTGETVNVDGPGYYLLVDPDTLNGENTAASSPILVLVGEGNTTIHEKSALPSLHFFVQEDSKVSDDNEGWYKEADQSILTDVNFKAIGTLPENLDAYGSYDYTFHLTEANDLSDPDNVKITIDDTELPASAYELKQGDNDGEWFFVIKDILALEDIDVNADSVIVLEYSSYMNDDPAEVVSPVMELIYTNNPMNLESTGNTTPEKVDIYHYSLNIHKVDKNTGEDLDGVEFSIYNETDKNYLSLDADNKLITSADPYAWTTKDILDEEGNITDKGMILINGIDADQYTIKEIKALDNYDKLESTITISYDITDRADVQTSITGDEVLVGTDTTDLATANVLVKNIKQISLPSTGAAGLGLLLIIAIIAAVRASIKRRQKEQAAIHYLN